MKRCPECRRDYYDDSLLYCLDDGTALLEGPTSLKEPATAILRDEGLPSEAETRTLDPGSGSEDLETARAGKPVLIIGLAVVILLAAVVGFVGYEYYAADRSRQIESIAVMPFVNESGNPEVEYLSDGMTETLIASLSRLPGINVKARSTVFRYKGKDAGSRSVGDELQVQAILNGRVVQRGHELVLNVELVDAQTENVLWTENYSRQMANLVSLQNDIARDLSQKLKTKLSGADEQKLSKNYTENAEAYQLYLKGRFHWYRRTEKDLQRSAEYFQEAITRDPNYALAYAGLADVYAPTGVTVAPNPALRRERLAKARETALKAVTLDDNLAEAHTALGTVLVSADYDFAGAEREYLRAIQLDPNYADAHYWYGTILNRLGRWDESFAEFQKALDLEPFNLIYRTVYGASLAWARRYDDAIDHLEKTREMDENFLPTIGNLATAYELKGDFDRAVAFRVLELDRVGFAKESAELQAVYAKQGRDGYLRYIVGDDRPAWVSSYLVSTAQAELGEKDKAIDALHKSYADREGLSQRLKVDPRLDTLRDDPRFKDLQKQMNLPE